MNHARGAGAPCLPYGRTTLGTLQLLRSVHGEPPRDSENACRSLGNAVAETQSRRVAAGAEAVICTTGCMRLFLFRGVGFDSGAGRKGRKTKGSGCAEARRDASARPDHCGCRDCTAVG